ncbi:MAG: c-type cytochrome [Arcobacter butzleri]|jgi:mono/diheme cytochrome c family protein|nr:c-type cytochrome [Arcobacteraceae bacterium]MDY0365156.1 c-type cytochrome [Arcobacteraceae bacterium]NLO16593.1 c-type cytochrome [Aliarcobacter butzleri]
MKISNLLVACLLLGGLFSFSSATETNQEVIYNKKCSECHGLSGEGNPAKKGPALNHQSLGDLYVTIMDLQGELTITGNSSGDHAQMEHNIKNLEQEGYIVDPAKMSKYINRTFNDNSAR